jgi:hypothetical protein
MLTAAEGALFVPMNRTTPRILVVAVYPGIEPRAGVR